MVRFGLRASVVSLHRVAVSADGSPLALRVEQKKANSAWAEP